MAVSENIICNPAYTGAEIYTDPNIQTGLSQGTNSKNQYAKVYNMTVYFGNGSVTTGCIKCRATDKGYFAVRDGSDNFCRVYGIDENGNTYTPSSYYSSYVFFGIKEPDRERYYSQFWSQMEYVAYDSGYLGDTKCNIPLFNSMADAADYIQSGSWANAVNVESAALYADWLVGYTNAEDTVYSVACDVPLFSDPDSDYYGKSDIASIYMSASYYYGESLISIYRTQYPYGQTWQGQLSDLIGQSDMSIANQIATKVASIMDIDNIMLSFYVSLNDSSGDTAHGYVEFDHNHVDDYGFSTEEHGDTISFRAGEILADSDSDTTNPEHEKEQSDTTPTEVTPDIQGAGLLTRTYVLTPQEAQGVGQFMWGANFMQNILLLNQSPIENVVSCKLFPIELSGSVANVKVGNVDTGTAGQVTSNNLIVKQSNSLTVSEHFHDNLRFLNYAPYTKIEVFLPFIGFKELPVDLVMGNSVKLVWVIDIVTGTLQTNIHITIDNVERHLYTFNSNIGIDIPLTAQNMAQIGSAFIQNVIGGGLGLASGLASGNAVGAVSSVVSSTANIATTQYHSQTTGTPSPNTAVVACLEPYLVITHPTCEDVGGTNRSTYKKLRGAPCYRAMKLGDLKGFTVIDKPDVVVDGATLSELEEINRLLSEGVYFGNTEE